MKDGIIKGTGNSRYLKSSIDSNMTWNQAVTALRNGTFPIDLNGINEAGWDQLPTWLNKQNLGQDKTMDIYNLGPEGTVDDLFQSVFAVGDIKVSARTDLGDHWLLCNGDAVDRIAYPNLVEILPSTTAIWSKAKDLPDSGVKYFVGKYIVNLDTSTGKYTYIDLETLSESGEESVPGYTDAKFSYAGGLYFIHPTGKNWRFYSSPNINGPWTEIQMPSIEGAGTSRYVDNFSYVNGYYVFSVGDSGYSSSIDSYIVYTKKVNSPSDWNYVKSPSGTFSVYDLFFFEKYWVMSYRNGSRYFTKYCENQLPVGPWIDMPTGIRVKNILKCGNQYAVLTLDTDTVSYGYDVYEAYIQGSLNLADLGSVKTSKIDYLFSVGDSWVYMRNVPNGSFSKIGTSKRLSDSLDTVDFPYTFISGCVYNDKLYSYMYRQSDNTRFLTIAYDKNLTVEYTPEISISGAYAYIRGK